MSENKEKKPLVLEINSPVRKRKGMTSVKKVSDLPKKIIKIDNVSITLIDDNLSNYPKVETLEELIKLDELNSNLVVDIQPPMFKKYFDNKTGKIITYVKPGDRVKIDRNQLTINDTAHGIVDSIRLASLGDMSIVVAVLKDKRLYITQALTKIED